MNSTELPIFYSKENLTTKFQDYSNVVLLPSICLFGMLTSLACLIGSFHKEESNAKILNYIFINSFVDFIFLLTQFFSIIVRCGALCPYGYTYYAKIYEIYVFWFVGYSLVNAQVMFCIYVAYDRLKMFSNKIDNNRTSLYIVFGVCLCIGVGFNIVPYGFSKDVIVKGVLVTPTSSNTTISAIMYKKIVREEFLAPIPQNILAGLLTIKDPIMFLILCVINFLVCFKFRQYLKNKKSLVNEKITNITKITSNFDL